jgi:hypothetical protein
MSLKEIKISGDYEFRGDSLKADDLFSAPSTQI